MGIKRCLACADAFQVSRRVPMQNYCGRPECQRERRKLWQQQKRRSDNDYQDNQLRCQRRWRASHTDYWRQYRSDHPEYVARNRELQRTRNATRQAGPVAKMDAMPPVSPLTSGTYRLSPTEQGEIAKMDAWIVKITLLSSA